MKKFLFLFSTAALLLSACKSEDNVKKESFNIDKTNVVLATGQEGSMEIMIKSQNVKPTANSDADWLTVEEITARYLAISYTTNESGAERVGHITIVPGKLDEVVVTVTQPKYAAPSDGDLKFGDLTEDKKGVIYWVDQSDRSIGKAISIARTTGVMYSSLSEDSGSHSLVNGYANTAAQLAKANPSQTYPAAYWCSQLGEGWYVPARDELLAIYDIYNGLSHVDATAVQPGSLTQDEKTARAAFDAILTAQDGEAMNTAGDSNNGQSYMASTEYDNDYIWYVRFGKFTEGHDVKKNSTSRYIRCIKTIGNYTYPAEPVTMTLSPATLNFEGAADQKEVTATVANGSIASVLVSEEGSGWCTASFNGNTITVTVTANSTGSQRTCAVNVSAEGSASPEPLVKEIAVIQKPLGGFKVGDLYEEGGKVAGVVFWTSEDAQTAKVVHIKRSETTLAWTTSGSEAASTYIGASDQEDGSVNFAAMKTWISAHPNDTIPAIAYCTGIGEGWYMPAKEELRSLFAAYNGTTFGGATAKVPGSISEDEKTARAAFDKLLTDNGGVVLNTQAETANGDQYIASTEVPESDGSTKPGQEIYSVRFGKVALNKDTGKTGTTRYIRAVKKISK